MALDQQNQYAKELLIFLQNQLGPDVVKAILDSSQSDESQIEAQRNRVKELKSRLLAINDAMAKDLLAVADTLVKKSVWLVGGDGWAYDIGFGGLDHVMASGRNVNLLVLDTEVYSNTGGQASKSTPLGALAKFAAKGKYDRRKNLGLMAMSYGNVYVAQVAMGASDSQTVRAFIEAESYDGPSLIIAYSHCIEHGIEMSQGLRQQKMAVESGYWTLYRHDPRLVALAKNPFQLDSPKPSLALKDYFETENRFQALQKKENQVAQKLLEKGQKDVWELWDFYQKMSQGKDVRD